MDRWVGKVAVVTGAAGGMGRAIYNALAKNGVLVVGLDKDLPKLKELTGSIEGVEKSKLYTRQVDIGKEVEIVDAFEWIKEELGGVDILVNNAGIGRSGKVLASTGADFTDTLNVNVIGTAICTREAVASMKSRDVAGHVINFNSVLGHVLDFPSEYSLSIYPPSKFAITALTEVVRRELCETNSRIKVTSISPGLTRTGIFQAAEVPDAGGIYDVSPYLQPEDIADAIIYILGTSPNVQVTELTIRPVGEIL